MSQPMQIRYFLDEEEEKDESQVKVQESLERIEFYRQSRINMTQAVAKIVPGLQQMFSCTTRLLNGSTMEGLVAGGMWQLYSKIGQESVFVYDQDAYEAAMILKETLAQVNPDAFLSNLCMSIELEMGETNGVEHDLKCACACTFFCMSMSCSAARFEGKPGTWAYGKQWLLEDCRETILAIAQEKKVSIQPREQKSRYAINKKIWTASRRIAREITGVVIPSKIPPFVVAHCSCVKFCSGMGCQYSCLTFQGLSLTLKLQGNDEATVIRNVREFATQELILYATLQALDEARETNYFQSHLISRELDRTEDEKKWTDYVSTSRQQGTRFYHHGDLFRFFDIMRYRQGAYSMFLSGCSDSEFRSRINIPPFLNFSMIVLVPYWTSWIDRYIIFKRIFPLEICEKILGRKAKSRVIVVRQGYAPVNTLPEGAEILVHHPGADTGQMERTIFVTCTTSTSFFQLGSWPAHISPTVIWNSEYNSLLRFRSKEAKNGSERYLDQTGYYKKTIAGHYSEVNDWN